MSTRLQTMRSVEVDEQEVRTADTAAPSQAQKVATDMLMMALAALSQRFVIALASLFTLVTVASAFYLWALALDGITPTQIVGLTIYSLFILAVNIYAKK